MPWKTIYICTVYISVPSCMQVWMKGNDQSQCWTLCNTKRNKILYHVEANWGIVSIHLGQTQVQCFDDDACQCDVCFERCVGEYYNKTNDKLTINLFLTNYGQWKKPPNFLYQYL